MPIWLIALALAGGGYYLYSRNSKSGGGFISDHEYVDKKGVHWIVSKDGDIQVFTTKGYGGDASIRGKDQDRNLQSLEEFASNSTPV